MQSQKLKRKKIKRNNCESKLSMINLLGITFHSRNDWAQTWLADESASNFQCDFDSKHLSLYLLLLIDSVFFFFALFLINNNNLSGKQLCCYFCSPVHFVNCPLVRTLNFTFCTWLPATILSLRIHSTGFVYSLHIFIIYSVQSSVDDYWSNGSN